MEEGNLARKNSSIVAPPGKSRGKAVQRVSVDTVCKVVLCNAPSWPSSGVTLDSFGNPKLPVRLKTCFLTVTPNKWNMHLLKRYLLRASDHAAADMEGGIGALAQSGQGSKSLQRIITIRGDLSGYP
jgi:hypothetical protein